MSANDSTSGADPIVVHIGMGIPYGARVSEPNVELSLSPERLRLRLRAVSRLASRLLPFGLPNDATIERAQVIHITRGLTGSLTITHSSPGVPSPIWIATAADNRRLTGLFESRGYVVEDKLKLGARAQRALLAGVLLVDAGVLLGMIVGPGAWTFILFPVMWFVTLLWALPRLR